ncbi:CinA family protein [Amycolatopsis cihanbeyliensis]|uniref:Nicotinamide-nucleotide amidase n=1 Tax=Amycolatopsis cihanbeyliensis TaxID=1128664 RepID=A0A542CT96_AMYCI|nr:nicotinamide-nucleotide amidohydrolase family protein [Amycolatopsis cihanbeyliensis]TQI94010.1 nicotinamide-nucleotide amidase [Amycolatopsis cihanbeyliensis]
MTGIDARAVVTTLTSRGESVAAAESLTAGLVCATLAEVPGASAVLRGGLVVYATELKVSLAGVDPALLAERGAVHPEVAAQLAAGARRICGADWGLGLTGVAGPDPQDGIDPGTAHVGLAGQGVRTTRTLRLSGDRTSIRVASAAAALDLLREHLR